MKIDFVITWVDDSDPEWRKERKKYSDTKIDEKRFRDWDFLKYWFRSIEINAPWVNKIYFITYGHLPKWLNIKNEKLVIINHKDYIDSKYLPTFNSCVLEINMHKIRELSEHFVYFNDDMFIIDKVKPTDFFVDGLPCDSIFMKRIWSRKIMATLINYNCNELVNKHYEIKDLLASKNIILEKSKTEFLKKYLFKKYKNMVCVIPQHVPTSFCKSTFYEVWEKEGQYLNNVCKNKFRTSNDVSQWLFQIWQIASNKVYVRDASFSKYYEICKKSIKKDIDEIIRKKHKLICLNDGDKTDNFEVLKKSITAMFEELFPNKSSFELEG